MKTRFYMSMLAIFTFVNASSLGDVVELQEIIDNSEYNSEIVELNLSSKNEKIDKNFVGMKISIEEKKIEKKVMDISIKNAIERILEEDKNPRKNLKTLFQISESSPENKKNIGSETKVSGILDRVLEINYQEMASKLKNYYQEFKKNKILYLTFDDGPLKGTENVLKILKNENIEATMFCVGRHVLKRKELFLKEKSMPNLQLVNHTYSHANGRYQKFYNNSYKVISDIEHAQLIIGGTKFLRLAGRNVWRLPTINRNDYGLPKSRRRVEVKDYNLLAKEGFFIVGWDIEWGFNHNTGMPTSSAETLAKRIDSLYKKGRLAKKGRVVLLTHDFMFKKKKSANELRKFIHIMRNNGWKFRKINHYVSTQPKVLKVAKYYKANKKTLLALQEFSNKKVKINKEKDKESINLNNVLGNKKNTSNSGQNSLYSQLNKAIKEYDAEKVNHILKMGLNLNHRDEYGRLALNTAVKINDIRMVRKLVSYGAKLDCKDKWGNTPVGLAKRYKRFKIARYFARVQRPKRKRHLKRHYRRKYHKYRAKRFLKRKRVVRRKKIRRRRIKRRDALSILSSRS